MSPSLINTWHLITRIRHRLHPRRKIQVGPKRIVPCRPAPDSGDETGDSYGELPKQGRVIYRAYIISRFSSVSLRRQYTIMRCVVCFLDEYNYSHLPCCDKVQHISRHCAIPSLVILGVSYREVHLPAHSPGHGRDTLLRHPHQPHIRDHALRIYTHVSTHLFLFQTVREETPFFYLEGRCQTCHWHANRGEA